MAVALHHSLTNRHPAPAAARGLASRAAGALLRFVLLWAIRRDDRRAVENFDDRELRDIGMSRWELRRSVAGPFWRA
jgi:uncharacterized protein YjiS (DUF1127 family)